MDNRIIKIISPLGKSNAKLKTNAASFDDIANKIKSALGIDGFENLKAIISKNGQDDGNKKDLRGLALPEGDITIFLTQDKTTNGLSKAQQIEECQARLDKAIKAKKGGVAAIRAELEALKGGKSTSVKEEKPKTAPKTTPAKKVAKTPEKPVKKGTPKPTPTPKKDEGVYVEVLSSDECIPAHEVEKMMKHNLKVRRRY
jgi:hypothetical protein